MFWGHHHASLWSNLNSPKHTVGSSPPPLKLKLKLMTAWTLGIFASRWNIVPWSWAHTILEQPRKISGALRDDIPWLGAVLSSP